MMDGRLCKSTDKTRRYIGSYQQLTATTVSDSQGGTTTQVGGNRYLYNYYNRVKRGIQVIDTTSFWTPLVGPRSANGAFGNRIEYFVGVIEDSIKATVNGSGGCSGQTRANSMAVGENSISAYSPACRVSVSLIQGATSQEPMLHATYENSPPVIGSNLLTWLESGGDGTVNFYGHATSGFNNNASSGLVAEVWC
jgi:hypothetical protein